MVRHDAHDFTDLGPRVAAREIEEAVLLREGMDFGLGVFEDQPEAIVERAGVGRQRLGAGVEDTALGRRTLFFGS